MLLACRSCLRFLLLHYSSSLSPLIPLLAVSAESRGQGEQQGGARARVHPPPPTTCTYAIRKGAENENNGVPLPSS
jgi:hypothetical protein